jgi:GNAT superfamily N-acetyltransferase
LGGKPKPGGKGGGAEGADGESVQGVRKPGGIETKQARAGAVERSTGTPEHDEAIKAGGGIPAGTMDLGEFGKIVSFHEPETGTTLGFKPGQPVTAEAVKAKIAESRKQYGLETKQAASPAMAKLVADTDWKEETPGVRTLRLKGPEGQRMGELSYTGRPTKDYAAINMTGLQPEFRGQGIGKEAYKSAIEDARAQGYKALKSDTTVSNAAQNVWKSLAREGYPITAEHTGEMTDNGDGGMRFTVDLTKPKGDILATKQATVISPEKAQLALKKIAEQYGTTDDVAPLRREHSFVLPDGKLVHLGNTSHTDVIADHTSIGAHEGNNWDNRPEFVNKSGAVRAQGYQNSRGDNLTFSVPASGVTPEQHDTMKRAASQDYLRNGTLNVERADLNVENKDKFSQQKQFPRVEDVTKMLKKIGGIKKKDALATKPGK